LILSGNAAADTSNSDIHTSSCRGLGVSLAALGKTAGEDKSFGK